MKAAAGNDPGFRFNDATQTIETNYSYQQITEQYKDSGTTFRDDLVKTIDLTNNGMSQFPAKDALRYFGTKPYKDQQRFAEQAIAEMAKLRLAKYRFDGFDANFSPARCNTIDQGLAGASPGQGAHVLLHDQNFEGFSLGESHSEAASKKYLIENMAALKGEGVNTIYVEHLRYREYQGMVDDWLRSPDPTLSGPLATFADASDRNYGLNSPDTLRGVLESAKANGMRVVGVDDSLAKGQTAEDRVARMNTYTEHIIRTDTGRNNGKYVILVGAAHNNTHEGKDGGVPGLSQLLEIPAVTVGGDGKLVRDAEDTGLRAPKS